MRHLLATVIGKAVRGVAGLRGGGSAAPGLVAEKIDPQFLPRALANLPYGVVVVSGTNGKTTTTKMLVELLAAQGLTVFTNRSGSNFTRGVVASVLAEKGIAGKVNADVAVLELDEAHAVHFVKLVSPRTSLLLNVMRDQLDRFGEIEYTANLLAAIAAATTDTLVLNREDPRIRALAAKTQAKNVVYYGLSADLRRLFPTDDEMREAEVTAQGDGEHHQEHTSGDRPPNAAVTLTQQSGTSAAFEIAGKEFSTELKVNGLYNTFNAAAALATAQAILGDNAQPQPLIDALGTVEPAFGRGEALTVNGQPLELVLVKNPAGFRLALKSFPAADYATMIAINDNYADGRDMSWLWDVDFDSLGERGVQMVSGVRAADMALRLKYDGVAVTSLDEALPSALATFINGNPGQPKRIYTTYTAMLALRRELAKFTDVKAI
ncbi:Mur ligase family protein [Haematomicrobium sanguinis]|uniref:Mur ligase family protein n=1 Tax=Haematomicrobium sanguinis TaxID=479106 RepID=UPI000479C57E|nr:Mur ligase family protein [Haematomicrobium sanguinis]